MSYVLLECNLFLVDEELLEDGEVEDVFDECLTRLALRHGLVRAVEHVW